MKHFPMVLALWLSTVPLPAGADLTPPPCVSAKPIAIGETVNGQLTTECSYFLVPIGAPVPPPEQRHYYYYESYVFSGSAGQQISILLTSSAFDAYVEVYNTDLGGQALAWDDNGGGGYDARIPPMSGYFTLPATGTYTIRTRTAQPDSTTGSYTLTLSAARKPDLNQHGLTGSWYELATGGQGVEVEVFANPSAGTGSTFVSWFTYDTVSGGAERQRWYTAQGQVVSGQPNAALTIYRNTGGNFNAPPATTAQVVGTATLSFETCSSGQLSYSFTDGTGRTGTMPLTRLTQNVTCSTTTSYLTNADFALSGNWYDPATSGQGFTVEVNPSSGALFAAWYTYLPNGTASGAAGQRWYTAQAAFTPGLRSMPVTIYETTGGVFDISTPSGQKTVPVGTGTMAFQSCSAATFSYNFTGGSSSGLSGTINLSRVGPVPPGCTS